MSDVAKPENLDLFSEWANLLPKGNEAPDINLNKRKSLGQQFTNVVNSVETSIKHSQPVAKESNNSSNKSEKDFKPPFTFELKSDNDASPNAFECVYDFCLALEAYCKNQQSGTLQQKRLYDIEQDWYRLLLACSSHNYERFMWIHFTFQTSLNLNLSWTQVVRRLQAKHDVITRRSTLTNCLLQFQYVHHITDITVINMEFLRAAEELGNDEKSMIEIYLSGLPENVKKAVESTMHYDQQTEFNYSLRDIQQRASVCILAEEGSFIFYSKTAHLSITLAYDKVNQRDCEFHLLEDHSTTSCPDYTVIRYPYMDFTPIVDSHDLVLVGDNSLTDMMIDSGITKDDINDTNNMETNIDEKGMTAKTTIECLTDDSSNNVPPAMNNKVLEKALDTPNHLMYNIPTKNEDSMMVDIASPTMARPTTGIINPISPPAPKIDASSSDVAFSLTTQSPQHPQPTPSRQPVPDPRIAQKSSEILTNDSPRLLKQQQENIPVAPASMLSQRVNATTHTSKSSSTGTNINVSSDPRHSHSRPELGVFQHQVPIPLSRPRSRSRSPDRYERRHYYPSHTTNSHSYHRTTDDRRSPSNSSSDVEQARQQLTGCFIHGASARHNTKECHQAQTLFKTTKHGPPHPHPHPANPRYVKACVFCGDAFSRGHLKVCTKVKPHRK